MNLELRGVKKSFPMAGELLPILRGVNLQINSGEFLSIMGPSGSGKTTLMNIIGLLDRPSEGEYHLDGQPVADLGRNALARLRSRSVGYVYQNFNLIPRESTLANVETPLMYQGLGPKVRCERAMAALERVGMAHRSEFQPSQLSGGQQQRVAIARALAGGAGVLLADEPTGNLDTRTGLQIMALFEQLHREGHTVILVTHGLEIVRHTQRTISIRDGKIQADQTNLEPVQAQVLLASLPEVDA